MKALFFTGVFLFSLNSYAKFVECFQPDNPTHRVKAIYHSKTIPAQFYGFFNNGRRTVTSGMEHSVNKEGEVVLHSGNRPMKVILTIGREYYADGIKPTGRISRLQIGFQTGETVNTAFVCRTYRWLK